MNKHITILVLSCFTALHAMEKKLSQENTTPTMQKDVQELGLIIADKCFSNETEKLQFKQKWEQLHIDQDLSRFLKDINWNTETSTHERFPVVLKQTNQELLDVNEKSLSNPQTREQAQKMSGLISHIQSLFQQLDDKIFDLVNKNITYQNLETVDACLAKVVHILQTVVHVARVYTQAYPEAAAVPLLIAGYSFPPLLTILMGVTIATFALLQISNYIHSLKNRVGEKLRIEELDEIQQDEKKAVTALAKPIETFAKEEDMAVREAVDRVLSDEELEPVSEEIHEYV